MWLVLWVGWKLWHNISSEMEGTKWFVTIISETEDLKTVGRIKMFCIMFKAVWWKKLDDVLYIEYTHHKWQQIENEIEPELYDNLYS